MRPIPQVSQEQEGRQEQGLKDDCDDQRRPVAILGLVVDRQGRSADLI
jgi:hypothetical protein